LIREYYCNFDFTGINIFFCDEVRDNGWEIFNFLFIRKAVDIAMDLGGNEKEAC
jgi:hypothetical protein